MANLKNKACPRNTVKEQALQAKKKTIFDAAKKIGKLEVLNDFGRAGGTVQKGLEQLAIVSNIVRSNPNVSTESGILVEDGSGLMNAMELGGSVQAAVANFSPEAVNGAVGASKALVARAKQGNFKMEDIATGIAEFKNIAQISSKIFTKPVTGDDSSDWQKFKCRPSPWAMDLVHQAPKQNFQFLVEIDLNAAYKSQFPASQQQEQKSKMHIAPTPLATKLAFLVKTAAKPSVNYEYEDLNYYNFHTQCVRKATFQPVTMTFIDDQLNTASKFYSFYTSAMSPIVNMGTSRDNASLKNYTQSGMDYDDTISNNKDRENRTIPNSFSAYSASVGALLPANTTQSNRTTTIIDRITIYQFGKNGNTMTAYNMFNPRITSFQTTEMSHAETGDGQSLTFEFMYDYYNIEPEINIGTDDLMSVDKLEYMSGGAAGATYTNRYFSAEDGPSSASKSSKSSGKGSWKDALQDSATNSVVDAGTSYIKNLF